MSQTAKTLDHVSVFPTVAKVGHEQRGKKLGGMEVRLVRYLDGHAGRFVAEWELKDFLYNGACSDAAVRFLVSSVRRKLGRAFIERGEMGGYRLSSQQAADLERVCRQCGRPVVAYEGEYVCYGCPSTAHADLDVGRTPYRAGSRSGTAWTEEEREFVIEHLDDLSLAAIGVELDRSESAVRGLLAGMGIRKPYVRGAGR